MTNETQAIEVRHGGPIDLALKVNEVVRQVTMIQELQHELMKEGTHYGVIPGTQKPTLYKAGAEKLALMFRLRCIVYPLEIVATNEHDGHREIVVYTHVLDSLGEEISTGVGSATTKESRYAYRYESDDELTSVPVPRKYWNDRDQTLLVRALRDANVDIGDASRVGTKKVDGRWLIVKLGDKTRVPNLDLPDQYNTILKMAKKRSFVDAILTATAASDFFTQDLEDLPRFVVREPALEVVYDDAVEVPNNDKPKDDRPLDAWERDSAVNVVDDSDAPVEHDRDHDDEPAPPKKGTKAYDLSKLNTALGKRGLDASRAKMLASYVTDKTILSSSDMTHNDIKAITHACKEIASTPVKNWVAFIDYVSMSQSPMTTTDEIQSAASSYVDTLLT